MKKQMKRTGKLLALVLAGLMAFSSLELSTFAADDVSIQTVSKTVTAELEMPENEELLTGYLEQIFYGNYISTFAVGLNTAGSRLSGDEKLVYDALVPYMKQIAAGSRVSTMITLGHEVNNGVEICPVDTEITFTGTFDDFDLGSVNEALLSDYPYEMYWYDKTVGVTINGYESDAISQITFTFSVASDYQNGDSTTINAAYATAATTAVANADAIITENASNSDYDKLVAYSNKIMELVSYDTNAAQNNTFSSDIDPWQLINVFDGVDTTNVVCEGYSKAFQYLCDKTTFTGDVSCYSVSGTMDGGGHMWNIVTIEDANYLVDVTNSESGTVGQDGTLFLAGTSNGSVEEGYTITHTNSSTTKFIYYPDTISFWGSDDDSILKLASESYEEEVVCVHEWTSYNADDTANTITAHCSTCEADYLTYTLQFPTENIYTGKVLETAKYVGSTNNIWNSTEPTITYTAKAGSSLTDGLAVNAGEYTVTMSWKGFSVSADYTIGKRSVTVTPKDQTIAVNETADATQITLGGEHNLAEGHNCTVTYAAVDTSSVGTKTLTIDTVTILDANSNDVTGNYNITKQTGTLNVKTHEHVWSYVANEENNTITATCSGSIGTCPDAEQSITLEAPEPASLNYNKGAKTATVTGSIEGVATPSVTYCCDGGCINAGEHTASITVGGKTVSVSFTIAKASVSDASVSVDPWADYTYTGNEIKPSVAVNVGGYSLNEGEDFTLVYTNNIDAGQATVTVTGQGNYEGTKSITYTIKQATASITQNPVAKTGLVYSAGAQDLIEAGATNGGELQYSLDNTNWSTDIPTGTTAKTYTVYYKVVGGKNYKDIAAQNFTVTIGPKEVTAPEFSGLNAQYLHTGSAVEPTFTLKEGQNTIPASEYEVAYSNNTNLGTATITISDVAGGNYTVSGSKTFEIVTHAHVWSYVANEENNTITATCSGSIGTCPVANNKVVITLVSPAGELVYDGTKKTVSVTQSPENVFTDLDDSDIVATNDCVSAGVHSVTLTYGGKSVSATFTIKQKESQYTAPDLLSAIYGNTLADVELPDNFTWQDALTTKVGNVGTNTFKATYTPDDVVNYTTVRDIDIPIKVSAKNITATVEVADGTYIYTGTAITPAVTVKDGSTVISETEYTVNYTDNTNAGTATITVTAKNGGNYSFTEVAKTFDIAQADNPPGKPASTLSTSYTNKKIGDITLSTGWEWLEADKDTALEVGESKTATANYTAADKNNYKNLTVVVTVTREACSHSGGNATCTEKATCSVCGKEYGSYGSHGSTEDRGVVAATCSANGYSGDSYCKDCGARVSYGYATAKLQHIYVTVVTKAPTCEETGTQTHTCSNCGDVLTETLLQKGHDYKSEITVEPTVEKEGVRTYTCKVCGHIYTKSIAKLEPEPEKTEPFIKGNNGKEGWDAISKELDDSKKDDIYIIDMNNGSTVPGEVIETVKGKEVIVVFDLGNDITWRVNGKNIAADKIDNIDFGIKVETPDEPLNNIPEDVLKKVKGDRESVDINLAYEGEFGFKAVLSINMGAENAGKYANLFYYNPATKSLDFVCADDVSVDGTATLTFDHASDYTIILDTTSMYNVSTEKDPVDGYKEDESTVSTETKENEESKPAGDKEADSSSVNELEKNGGGIVWFLVIGGVLLFVIIGVVLVVKKRNNDDF